MNIIEFAEKMCGCELLPYQKEYLTQIYELQKQNKLYIVYGPKGRVSLYVVKKAALEQVSGYTLEELTRMFASGFELKLPHDYLERSADEIGSIDIR